MLCYQDRSWCVWSNVCQNKTCERNLNAQEIVNATEWWGNGQFPVMYADLQTKECGAKI